MTDVIQANQVLTLIGFLGALGALWWAVQRNRAGLTVRLTRDRRLRLVEAAALGPTDRAMILAVDEQEFLVLRLKGAAPVLQPLGPARAATGVSA